MQFFQEPKTGYGTGCIWGEKTKTRKESPYLKQQKRIRCHLVKYAADPTCRILPPELTRDRRHTTYHVRRKSATAYVPYLPFGVLTSCHLRGAHTIPSRQCVCFGAEPPWLPWRASPLASVAMSILQLPLQHLGLAPTTSKHHKGTWG